VVIVGGCLPARSRGALVRVIGGTVIGRGMAQYGKPVKVPPVNIDPRSPEHPYQQLARQLREQIESGTITSQLPSITGLTAQTGLAVGTVRRAIDILVKEGLAQAVPCRGTFVKR